jgi:AcrR family transcriptional regulator
MVGAQLQARDLQYLIINASLELFYRNGIRATDLNKVIAKAGVSEHSFYENFHSKEDLVTTFLHRRHDIWFTSFETEVEKRLAGNGGGLEVIADVLQSWFEDPFFRGCAFINIVAEGGKFDSEPFAIAREHKEQLKQFIKKMATRMHLQEPELVSAAGLLVIEGAIVRAQMTCDPEEAQNARLLLSCLNHS